MIYIGSDGSTLQFNTKEKVSKQLITCSLTETFNVHLFSNHTAITDNKCDEVAFVVPTHLPSFVYHFLKEYNPNKFVDDLFVFRDAADRQKLITFAENIKDLNIRRITFL